MNMPRILKGTIVVGIVANALDWLLNTFFWADTWASLAMVNPTPPMMWLIIGNFMAALMLMFAWDKFGAASGKGPGAGFKFGLFAGAFVHFPMTLFWQMYIKDFPYMVAWKIAIVGIIWYGVLGAVAAMLDSKEA